MKALDIIMYLFIKSNKNLLPIKTLFFSVYYWAKNVDALMKLVALYNISSIFLM